MAVSFMIQYYRSQDVWECENYVQYVEWTCQIDQFARQGGTRGLSRTDCVSGFGQYGKARVIFKWSGIMIKATLFNKNI